MGNVWESPDLTMRGPLNGPVRASGRILRVLHDPGRRQIFLVCGNGQIVTLPDCPQCVRVWQAVDAEVLDGEIEGDLIILSLAGGSKKNIPMEEAAQYRVSISFAREKILPQGVIVDLRSPGEFAADHLTQSVNVPMGRLTFWLSSRDKAAPLAFLCRTGVFADTATVMARALGFTRAYSLGGILPWAHRE
jgi:phage shock protein E